MRNVWLPNDLWHDRVFAKLSPEAKLLFLYLHINPSSNLAGTFHLSPGYFMVDMRKSIEQSKREMIEIEAAGLIRHCKKCDWVWLLRHLEFEPVSGEKQIKAYMKYARRIPQDCSFFEDFKRHTNAKVWKNRRNIEDLFKEG